METPMNSGMPMSTPGSASKLPTILVTVLITTIVIIAGMYAFGFARSNKNNVIVETATPATSKTSFAEQCAAMFGSSKYWSAQYRECYTGDDEEHVNKMKEFCSSNEGTFTMTSTCHHVPAGEPCGPEAVAVCAFN